jgi:hypothetical protein
MPEQSALDRTLDVLEAERVPKFTQAVADAETDSAGLNADLVTDSTVAGIRVYHQRSSGSR